MIEITKKQFTEIHRDFRGTCGGKKTAFKNSILRKAGLPLENNGTELFFQDSDFKITKG